MEYEKYNHSVGVMIIHVEWCTKYRYKMFGKNEYRNLVSACIRRAASMHEIKIIELNVQPEHVHSLIGIKFSMNPSYAIQILKGISSRLFFKFHERAKLRYPKGHLWSRGKFVTSVGFMQFEAVRDYVRTQDEHHNSYGNRTL